MNPPPDASTLVLARTYHDAGVSDAEPAACFTFKTFTCGHKSTTVCVPYNGCSETIKCRGKQYGYCYFP